MIKKWEYLEDELNTCSVDLRHYWTRSNGWFKTRLEALNYLGESGWELVVKEDDSYMFKRPQSED
jgi:hypothetical protein